MTSLQATSERLAALAPLLEQGLSSSQVRAKQLQGKTNAAPRGASREYRQIIRENIFTFINGVLFILGVALVLIGRPLDALISVGVLFFNSAVGVAQEIRAKRKLEQIQLLYQPKATVIRDGREQTIQPEEIVAGDVLTVSPGDQILVDGTMIGDGQMSVDESQLTGESDLIPKRTGDTLYSGSFCVTGSGAYRAEKVGAESLANQLAQQARASRNLLTPLQNQINLVIRLILLLVVYLELLIIANDAINAVTIPKGVEHATVIASIVPTTLLATISLAYAVGALRVVRFGALAQQANAMESLSNVDLLCLDKTGTLTTNQFYVHRLYAIDEDEEDLGAVLGIMAASTSAPNKTTEAIMAAFPAEPRNLVGEVPFSSTRKWSAVALHEADRRGIYVLGALEMLRPCLGDAGSPESTLWQSIERQSREWAAKGLRVLLVAYHPEPELLEDQGDESCLPEPVTPLGLVSVQDELREDAHETLNHFAANGVSLKIISGDNPETVAALARQAGFDEDLTLVSGLELQRMGDIEFGQVASQSNVFGRITPQQKERLVDSLREQGHYVAMIGDGVNDVLSLKKANLGIAMQSGSQATRGVADIVLIQDSFDSLAPAVAEGQRIVNGMQDVLRLYLTRIGMTVLIILSALVIGVFPISLRQRPLFTTFTVAIPAVLLALWAKPGARPKGTTLAGELMHFAAPPTITSTILGLALFYGLIRMRETQGDLPTTIAEFERMRAEAILISQTVLVTFLTVVGLFLIIFAEPPTKWWTGADVLSGDWRPTILAVGLFGLFLIISTVPIVRDFFEMVVLEPVDIVAVTVASLIWLFATRYAWRKRLLESFLGLGSGRKSASAR